MIAHLSWGVDLFNALCALAGLIAVSYINAQTLPQYTQYRRTIKWVSVIWQIALIVHFAGFMSATFGLESAHNVVFWTYPLIIFPVVIRWSASNVSQKLAIKEAYMDRVNGD